MGDTPRTFAVEWDANRNVDYLPCRLVVDATFAEELERELASLRAEKERAGSL